jgi:CHASE2 domain-containing sensor protein
MKISGMKFRLPVLRFLKFLFPADAVFCTVFVFALMAGFKDLFGRFDFLNPVEIALTDFDMTDLIYSAGIREDQVADTNIVLVNIGNLPRRLIARELEIISRQNPKAVGIDASFLTDKDPYEDSLLESAMAGTRNLVLYSKLFFKNLEKDGAFDTIQFCHPKFARHGTSAFMNLVTPGEQEFRICRSFCPTDSVNGKKYLSFALQLAWFEDSTKVKQFLSRRNPEEIINFRGNSSFFYQLDLSDILGRAEASGFYDAPPLPISLRDKLVFMGYMGNSFSEGDRTVEDKFYSPLNPKFAGKAYPDMFGVTVHANIASMVLRGEPVDEMHPMGCYWLAILLCYLNVVAFFFILRSHPTWYDLFVKTIQIVEVALILYFGLFVYGVWHYKIDAGIAAFAVGFSGDVLEIYVGLKKKLISAFSKLSS